MLSSMSVFCSYPGVGFFSVDVCCSLSLFALLCTVLKSGSSCYVASGLVRCELHTAWSSQFSKGVVLIACLLPRREGLYNPYTELNPVSLITL